MHNDVCTFKLCLKSRRETEKVEKQGDFLACTVQTTLISDKLPELHLRKNIIGCAIAILLGVVMDTIENPKWLREA